VKGKEFLDELSYYLLHVVVVVVVVVIIIIIIINLAGWLSHWHALSLKKVYTDKQP
jgi:hypothetical protein